MYAMMMNRGTEKDFETIQSCIQAMKENGYLCRTVYFTEENTVFSKKIQIDQIGVATVGRKRLVKSL